MDKKIIVLDIDGTLVNSKKVITKKTLDGLKKIQDMGHIVALASGRPYPGMKKYVQELELDKKGGYVLSFNGGKIINCKTEETVYANKIPNKFAKIIYEYALSHDIGMVTYNDDMVITGTRIDEYMQYEARLNYMPLYKVDDFLSYVNFDMIKCLLTAKDDIAYVCEKELHGMLSPELNVFRSEPYFIEITNNGVDKAKSLENMLKIIDIERENCICCGDGFNDLTMIQFAGVGVAMANAQPIVKENADYITKSCDEDGIVDVIEKFIL